MPTSRSFANVIPPASSEARTALIAAIERLPQWARDAIIAKDDCPPRTEAQQRVLSCLSDGWELRFYHRRDASRCCLVRGAERRTVPEPMFRALREQEAIAPVQTRTNYSVWGTAPQQQWVLAAK